MKAMTYFRIIFTDKIDKGKTPMTLIVDFFRHANKFQFAEDAEQFANFFHIGLKGNVSDENFAGLLFLFDLSFTFIRRRAGAKRAGRGMIFEE